MATQTENKTDSLGILSMVGPSKYTKEQFINTYLFVLAKVGESIAISSSVEEIDTKAEFLLNFITESKKRDELRTAKNKMYSDAVDEYRKTHSNGLPDDKIRVIYKRQAANAIIGMINEYFDDVWGWSRNLKIAIAGPRGGNGTRFVPLKDIPEDLQKKLVNAMNYPKGGIDE
jgi:hypothetical protein